MCCRCQNAVFTHLGKRPQRAGPACAPRPRGQVRSVLARHVSFREQPRVVERRPMEPAEEEESGGTRDGALPRVKESLGRRGEEREFCAQQFLDFKKQLAFPVHAGIRERRKRLTATCSSSAQLLHPVPVTQSPPPPLLTCLQLSLQMVCAQTHCRSKKNNKKPKLPQST